jgi:formamidopyrimidine-DNA glycosylase
LGGLKYERDFYGSAGRYQYDLVGHKPGTPCPACGTAVAEIRTGSTRSFICPNCQK